MKRQRFAPHGTLAVAPGAFGAFFDVPEYGRRGERARSLVEVVEVVGPLMHHDDSWWFDSYDALKGRVEWSMAGAESKCVLLSIDSPGGLVAGCFDTVTELRMLSEKYGKPIFAYVDAQTESAAYALACAAERIFVPVSGRVGSIGCVEMLLDMTESDRAYGVSFVPIMTGERKVDGNPHVKISEEAIAAAQKNVDSLGAIFFDIVAERRGLDPATIRGLEARSFIGQEAIDLGLADEMATLDQVVAKLTAQFTEESSPAAQPAAQAAATSPGMVPAKRRQPVAGAQPVGATAMKLSEAKAGLKAIAEDENASEEDRENARKAIAAMEGDEDKDGDGDGDGDEDGAAAQGEEHEEPDGDEACDDKAAAAGGQVVASRAAIRANPTPARPASASRNPDLTMASRLQVLERDKADRDEREERGTLMASRPDFAASTVAFLDSQPIETVRAACKPHDKGGLPLGPGKGGQVGAARAALNARPTVPQGHGSAPTATGPEENHPVTSSEALDEAMGLRVTRPIVSETAGRLSIRCMSPTEARTFLKTLTPPTPVAGERAVQ